MTLFSSDYNIWDTLHPHRNFNTKDGEDDGELWHKHERLIHVYVLYYIMTLAYISFTYSFMVTELRKDTASSV